MSATNHTPNYNLPQFIGTDVPSWLTDVNGAFSAIDTGIEAAQTAAEGAADDTAELATRVTTAENAITNATGRISTLEGTTATQGAKIGTASLNTNAQNLSGAVNEINEKFEPALLWTNPDSTQTFAAGNITLDLSQYREIIIEARTTTGSASYETVVVPRKNIGMSLLAWTTTMIARRDFTVYDDRIYISNGFSSSNVSTSSQNNTVIIPAYIYGIK